MAAEPAGKGGPVLELLLPSGGTAFIVGTVHVHPQSAAQVTALVESKKPVIVALELCSERIGHFREPPPASSDAVYNVELGRFRDLLLELDASNGLVGVYSMLAKYAAASERGVYTPMWLLYRSEPGAEFRAGIRAAAAIGAEAALVDREISITTSRLTAFRLAKQYVPLLLALLTFVRDRSAVAALVSGGLGRLDAALPGPTMVAVKLQLGKSVSEDEFAAAVHEFVDAARSAGPSSFVNPDLVLPVAAFIPTALGDERDLLLARAIKSQAAGPGQTVVAVVGAAHLKGIAARWDSADSAANDALAASYGQRPPAWETAGVLLPAAGATVVLTALATGGLAAWGCRRLYRKLRGVPHSQTRWRIRSGPAAVGLVLVGGIGSALYTLSRVPPAAVLPAAAERAGAPATAPPKPAAPLAEFQRLLRATTFCDPETGLWTCRARA